MNTWARQHRRGLALGLALGACVCGWMLAHADLLAALAAHQVADWWWVLKASL